MEWRPVGARLLSSLAITFIGIACTAVGMREVYLNVTSQRWASTLGRVRDHKIGRTLRTVTGPIPSISVALIEYEYVVQGNTYRKTLGAFGPFFLIQSDHTLLDKFPIASMFELKYDPRAPYRSYVDRHVMGPAIASTSGGLFIFAIGLLTMFSK